MPSKETHRPLSRLFRAAPPPPAALQAQIERLDRAAPEELAALALHASEPELRAAAIARLPDGDALRRLAGLAGADDVPADFAQLAQERIAALIDARQLSWTELSAGTMDGALLMQIAECCADPQYLEQQVATIADAQEIARLVVEGSSIRVQQLAAHRVEERGELNRLLKQLHGKDKSVYRILKDKRDALRIEDQHSSQLEQEVRTLCASLEALATHPYDALYEPAFVHFEARWQTYLEHAQPWARERVGVALDRCRSVIDAQRAERVRREALEAERNAQQAAREAARIESEAQAAESARLREATAAAVELARLAEDQARDAQRAADAVALRQIGSLMAKAHGALRAGHTGPAAGLRRAIEEKLSTAPALPAPLARGLQELDAKLTALKEWKDYAVSPKRAELIAEMEALIGSAEKPQALAERIRDLRAHWKTISQGVVVDSEADWQRFNQAAATAYEPCRVHFEAQAALRAANVERRRHVLERLQAFENNQNGEHPDWRLIGQVLHEAPLEWRRIGPVERGAIRPIEAEFEGALARLRGRLDAWQAQNAAAKQALIQGAEALLSLTDDGAATEGAKALQRQWREIGPARRDQEGALWNAFRAHCDGVFKKREAAFAEQAAGLETHKTQAIALCEEIERAAGLTGPELLEAAKDGPQWRGRFEALGELPRSEARALQKRFERALSECQSQVLQQRRRDAALVFDHLIQAAQHISAYGWAVAEGADQSARESLKAAAEIFIAGISQWPKGAAPALKAAWAKAGAASTASATASEAALRLLCIRGEIATERPTPEEDQGRRRSYQLERLVQVMGRHEEAAANDWESLALEWVAAGPVSAQAYEPLLARFRLCRKS